MTIRRRVFFYATISLLLLCMGVWFLEDHTKVIRHAVDDILFDNRNHYLPCDQLPDEEIVKRVLEEHQDTIAQIESVAPGFVGVEIGTTACPRQADLLFYYGTHQQRQAVETIIGGETFFGVPYNLQNR